jgi:ADP-ribosylglycohydrolase
MKADFEALILGVAVGDALGLPAEGLPPQRIQRRWRGRPWEMRLYGGYGLISDDTEHTVMVALALLKHPKDAEAFQSELARRLRWWSAALPPGTGLATIKACLKLWLGFPPQRSGIFSAGNGPAMRSAILGAFFADDAERRHAYVTASTRITHTDPKAEVAAQAIAEAAAWEVTGGSQDDLLVHLASLSEDEEWAAAMKHLRVALDEKLEVAAFVHRLGLHRGVSGYAYHTVPVALYGWLRHRGDLEHGLVALIDCGGDTDTVAAIAGALMGLAGGTEAIPTAWLDKTADWPLSVSRLRELAMCFDGHTTPPFRWWHWLAMPLRNVFMLAIVLAHGLRRLVP